MRLITTMCLAMSLFAGIAYAAQPKATVAERISSTRQLITVAQQGKPGSYAKDLIEKSTDRLLRAQHAAESGDQLLAGQSLDIADLLLKLAHVKADERESEELTATKRAELKALESKIENLLQGKEQ